MHTSNREIKTTLEDIKKGQALARGYLYSRPKAFPVQYYVLLGERSIGKTHMIIEEMYGDIKDTEEAFMIIVRSRLQLGDVTAICDKYGHVLSGRKWITKGGRILEQWEEEEELVNEKGEVEIKLVKQERTIGYYEFLNKADNKKTANYDNPKVRHIFFDEIYSYRPAKDEWRKFKLIMGTVGRSFGEPLTGLTVWFAGNLDMGVSPILEELKVDTSNKKWRNNNVVVYNSDLKSPDASLNIYFSCIEDKGKPKEYPAFSWSYLGKGYEAHQFENHIYVCESKIKGPPISSDILRPMMKAIIKQRNYLKPMIFQNAKCMHIANFLRLNIY